MLDANQVLANLPPRIRDELLECYQDIMSNYAGRRWRASELDGGRFCEIVFSILEGALKGSLPAKASKPRNMFQSCIELEKKYPPDPARVGDRSLRIMMPRLLPVLYEVRNNRNVGHVGGDVSPDHMDAEAVQSMASWLMAELVRVFHGVSTAEAEEVVDALVERKMPVIWEPEPRDVKRILDAGMPAKNQVLILLHQSTGWVRAADLQRWVEYKNPTNFRKTVLGALHKGRLIEFDGNEDRAKISPLGMSEVEERLLAS